MECQKALLNDKDVTNNLKVLHNEEKKKIISKIDKIIESKKFDINDDSESIVNFSKNKPNEVTKNVVTKEHPKKRSKSRVKRNEKNIANISANKITEKENKDQTLKLDEISNPQVNKVTMDITISDDENDVN